MADPALKPPAALYDEDFVRWSEDQARALAERHLDALDLDNLAEEIDSLGRAQKNELSSRLVVLLAHLPKRQIQPEWRSHSWQTTTGGQRTHVEGLLATSPSLRGPPDRPPDRAYRRSRRTAQRATRLRFSVFPGDCLFTTAQALDEAFFPGPDRAPDDLPGDPPA